MSLYSIDIDDVQPQRLLPEGIALPDPSKTPSHCLFKVFPKLSQILLMLDLKGDGSFQPYLTPLEGGMPKSLFSESKNEIFICFHADIYHNMAYFSINERIKPVKRSFRIDMETLERVDMGSSAFGNEFQCATNNLSKAVMRDVYSPTDHVLYLWNLDRDGREILIGIPFDERRADLSVQTATYRDSCFTPDQEGVLSLSSRFSNSGDIIHFDLDYPEDVTQVEFIGFKHPDGFKILDRFQKVHENIYLIEFKIKGHSYVYEAELIEGRGYYILQARRTLCGEGHLSQGVLQSISEERHNGQLEYVLSLSRANLPPLIIRLGKNYPHDDYFSYSVIR